MYVIKPMAEITEEAKIIYIRNMLLEHNFEKINNSASVDLIYRLYKDNIQDNSMLGDDPQLLYFYGVYYHKRSDHKLAAMLYQKSAELGYVASINHLADYYFNGYGVTRDYKKAFEYWQKSADSGNIYGINNLGNRYYDGYGVEQDYVKAFECYQRSAQKSSSCAMKNLGLCYMYGHGTSKDLCQAAEWLKKAADIGLDEAKNLLNKLLNSEEFLSTFLNMMVKNREYLEIIEEKEKQIQHLKLYPGTDFKQAMVDYNLLAGNMDK